MSAINHTKGALFLGTRGDSNNQIPSKYFGFIKMLTYPILTARSLATLSGASNDKIPSKYFGLIKMFSLRMSFGLTLFGMPVCLIRYQPCLGY